MASKAPKDDLVRGDDGKTRCSWNIDDPDFCKYHDEEFGRPVDDDRRIFEKICIEGFGAGLSFLTVLKKREAFRKAFDNFEIKKVAKYNDDKIATLMENEDIIQNERKIKSVVNNAQCALELIDEVGSLAAFLWSFEPDPNDRPKTVDMTTLKEVTQTEESKRMAAVLKKRGWSYVGPTTLHAVMQSLGVLNDHFTGCDFREECLSDRKKFTPPKRIDQA